MGGLFARRARAGKIEGADDAWSRLVRSSD
jgi:hypothetical protein